MPGGRPKAAAAVTAVSRHAPRWPRPQEQIFALDHEQPMSVSGFGERDGTTSRYAADFPRHSSRPSQLADAGQAAISRRPAMPASKHTGILNLAQATAIFTLGTARLLAGPSN
jgi:hypothetical protein